MAFPKTVFFSHKRENLRSHVIIVFIEETGDWRFWVNSSSSYTISLHLISS